MIELALICLTANIYHEARGEPPAGQMAVATVTMRRANRMPGKVCRVTRSPRQFSWVGKGKKVTDRKAWNRARFIARKAIDNRLEDNTRGATHFHAKYYKGKKLVPSWSRHMTRVATIGNHHFYRAQKKAPVEMATRAQPSLS